MGERKLGGTRFFAPHAEEVRPEQVVEGEAKPKRPAPGAANAEKKK
jgi:hypothetical protein